MPTCRLHCPTVCAIVILCLAASAGAQPTFVNWESPHVHPIDLTPDGNTLLVCNTPDNRLEVFDVSGGTPVPTASIPVGLDPVSVRARNNTVAWVVNHISDDVSIVDLPTARVVWTFRPGDEPCDVVFAGTPQRAFVSVSQINRVKVYDPDNVTAVVSDLAIAGEDPRALATDGTRVFAAVFESGNRTTILDFNVVSQTNGPYGGTNPPPNNNTSFLPALRAGNPVAPRVSLIVKHQNGRWEDDNSAWMNASRNWNSKVTWNVHDHDVAIINATAPHTVTYATDLMNLNMAMAVRPDGMVTVVGTDAINHVRFEPNVQSKFVKVMMATFNPGNPATPTRTDLNPHLDYQNSSVPPEVRMLSVGDPRGIVWNSTGTAAYVAGMGSNNVIAIGPDGSRLATIPVSAGPTGLVLKESQSRLYVVNKFEGSVSVIDTSSSSEVGRVPFYDPTPATIQNGRPFLYDTHLTSGTGHVSCGSCHVDGRMDNITWDLGDPSGEVKPFNQSCNLGIPLGGTCEDWHPMKGPMATQTLFGIVGTEPLHWRGDRENLAAFNPAFPGLLGGDTRTAGEMAAFQTFLANTTFPPQPNRNFDGSLRTSLVIDDGSTGNAVSGASLFQTGRFDGGLVTCVQCHLLPTGSNPSIISGNLLQETQSVKVPQLRNMHEKTGFLKTSQLNNRGFSLIHDGSVDTMVNFLRSPVFNFTSDQQRRDLSAFMFSFSTDTHASVGWQQTLDATNNASNSSAMIQINSMITLANANTVGLVVKGHLAGIPRGFMYIGGNNFRSDRNGENRTKDQLRLSAGAGSELTFTVVPRNNQTRIGIDRDLDGSFDRDEIDGCGGDPANPMVRPRIYGDLNNDNVLNASDAPLFATLMTDPDAGTAMDRCVGDMNRDGQVDGDDLPRFVSCVMGSCQ